MLLWLIPVCSMAQKTKKKSFRYKQSKALKEEYYVLKENKKVKHGSYQSFYANGKPQKTGGYNNGHKHGKWISYKHRGGISEIQHYINGKKTGIWEKYIESGQVVARYDHDMEKALKSKFFILIGYPRSARDNEIEGTVSCKLTINSKCEIQKVELVKSLGYGCDDEVRYAMEKLTAFSKKYELEFEGVDTCEDREIVLDVNFNLN